MQYVITDFAALKQRCEAEMSNHDSASVDQRLLNYAGKGFAPVLDPEWNRENRTAPKSRYTLSPAQLRRIRSI